ncbi:hypothetical protein [Phocaeicola sp.]
MNSSNQEQLFYPELGRLIEDIRCYLGLKICYVASTCHIGKSTYGKVKSGRYKKLSVYVRLAFMLMHKVYERARDEFYCMVKKLCMACYMDFLFLGWGWDCE